MSTADTAPDGRPPLRRRLLMVAIVIAAVGLALALARGLARDILVVPLLYTLWSLQNLLASLPQVVLWVALVAMAVVVALRSLTDTPSFPTGGRRYRDRYGRVESWVRLLGQARREDYARWRLAQRTAVLLSDLMVERERIDPRDARHAIERGIAHMDPEVRAFMRGGLTSFRPRPRGLAGLRAARSTALHLDPARAVDFIEGYAAHMSGAPADDDAR